MEVWQHIPFISNQRMALSGGWREGVIVRDGEHAVGRGAARRACLPD